MNKFDVITRQSEQGLSGGLSSLWKEVKRAGRKIEDEIKRAGRKIDDNKEKILGIGATLLVPGVGAALGGAVNAGAAAVGSAASALTGAAGSALSSLKLGSIANTAATAAKTAVGSMAKDLVMEGLIKAGVPPQEAEQQAIKAVGKAGGAAKIDSLWIADSDKAYLKKLYNKIATPEVKANVEKAIFELRQAGMSETDIAKELMQSQLFQMLAKKAAEESTKTAVQKTARKENVALSQKQIKEIAEDTSSAAVVEARESVVNKPKVDWKTILPIGGLLFALMK